jgi:predicted Ser/Thr protein kinase
VAPRALAALARFAVLTRLRRPDPDAFPAEIREAVAGLSPPGKLRLYETGEAPEGLDEPVRRLLAASVTALRDERRDALHYEGRHGASAREIRSVLSAAAADPGGGECLGVGVLFRHLRALLGERTVYEFLRIEPAEGYHRAADFADEAEARAARLSLEDLQEALELVPPGEYLRRFEKYVAHAVAFDRGEKVRPPGGGPPEAPDGEVLHAVEKLLDLRETPAAFRASLVSRLGAFGVEHPGTKPDLALLFPGILRALREEYFRGMREKVRRVEAHILAHGTPEFDRLDRPHRELVERALRNLENRFGYCPRCAREAVAGMRSAAGR